MATREQVCKQRQASAGHEPAGTRFLKKKKKAFWKNKSNPSEMIWETVASTKKIQQTWSTLLLTPGGPSESSLPSPQSCLLYLQFPNRLPKEFIPPATPKFLRSRFYGFFSPYSKHLWESQELRGHWEIHVPYVNKTTHQSVLPSGWQLSYFLVLFFFNFQIFYTEFLV